MIEGELKRAFGTAIKAKRAELGITQEVLADRAGLHRTYISDVERGARNLSIESIEKLAVALELSVSALFRHVGNGRESPHAIEILLVEDEPNDVTMTLRAFRRAHFANPVHVVRDGREALDFTFGTGRHADRRDAPRPGIILLDLKLPKLGGIEVLRRLRADSRTRALPVIVLTASEHDHDAAECRRLGVETYLVKPVNFRSFSEVTPHLQFAWKLVKPLARRLDKRKRNEQTRAAGRRAPEKPADCALRQEPHDRFFALAASHRRLAAAPPAEDDEEKIER